jgi:hypothetical protein
MPVGAPGTILFNVSGLHLLTVLMTALLQDINALFTLSLEFSYHGKAR